MKIDENRYIIEFFRTHSVSNIVLMKIMCCHDDFVGFRTYFGGFRWILHGFWSLSPLWRPENTENLEKVEKKSKNFEKNFIEKYLKT